MLIIDLAIVVCMIAAMADGYRKGFVRIAANIAALIAAFIFARVIAEQFKTIFADRVVLSFLERQLQNAVQGQESWIHVFFQEGITGVALQKAAENISYTILFLLSLTLLQIVFQLGIKMLGFINRIPFVGKINRIVGLIAGLVWFGIIFFIIMIVLFTVVPQGLLDEMWLSDKNIEQTVILKLFVNFIRGIGIKL